MSKKNLNLGNPSKKQDSEIMLLTDTMQKFDVIENLMVGWLRSRS